MPGEEFTLSDFAAFLPADPHLALRARLEAAFGPQATIESLLAACAADVALTMHGHRSHYAFSGVYRGAEAIRGLRRRMDGEIAISDRQILNLMIEGDRFALRRGVNARHHGTAATQRLAIANFGRVENGLIVELHEYADTDWLNKMSDAG